MRGIYSSRSANDGVSRLLLYPGRSRTDGLLINCQEMALARRFGLGVVVWRYVPAAYLKRRGNCRPAAAAVNYDRLRRPLSRPVLLACLVCISFLFPVLIQPSGAEQGRS